MSGFLRFAAAAVAFILAGCSSGTVTEVNHLVGLIPQRAPAGLEPVPRKSGEYSLERWGESDVEIALLRRNHFTGARQGYWATPRLLSGEVPSGEVAFAFAVAFARPQDAHEEFAHYVSVWVPYETDDLVWTADPHLGDESASATFSVFVDDPLPGAFHLWRHDNVIFGAAYSSSRDRARAVPGGLRTLTDHIESQARSLA